MTDDELFSQCAGALAAYRQYVADDIGEECCGAVDDLVLAVETRAKAGEGEILEKQALLEALSDLCDAYRKACRIPKLEKWHGPDGQPLDSRFVHAEMILRGEA